MGAEMHRGPRGSCREGIIGLHGVNSCEYDNVLRQPEGRGSLVKLSQVVVNVCGRCPVLKSPMVYRKLIVPAWMFALMAVAWPWAIGATGAVEREALSSKERMSAPDGTVLVEAEKFDDFGGSGLDQQFMDQQLMDQMGSPYRLTHGMGRPVSDARTRFRVAGLGPFLGWVRTRDWGGAGQCAGPASTFSIDREQKTGWFVDEAPVDRDPNGSRSSWETSFKSNGPRTAMGPTVRVAKR